MNKKRSTPPNPAAAAREAAQGKARDERQQNQGSPEHRCLPEGVPYRDPVSPLEKQDPNREHLLEGTYAQGILGSVASHPLSIGAFQKVFPIGILSLPLRNDSIPCIKGRDRIPIGNTFWKAP